MAKMLLRLARDRLSRDGVYAWTAASVAFLALFLSVGPAYSFGVYYIVLLETFQVSGLEAAWVGSLNMATLCLGGPLAGAVIQRYGFRVSMLLGVCLSSTGLFISSFCTSIYHLYVTYGIITGLGYCLLFTTSVVLVPAIFKHYRVLAAGLSISGVSFGNIIQPWISQKLINYYGWRGSLIVTSGITLHIAITAMLLKPHNPKCNNFKSESYVNAEQKFSLTSSLKSVNGTAVTESRIIRETKASTYEIITMLPFWLLALNTLFFCFSMSGVYTHVANYALHLDHGRVIGGHLISTLGLSNLLGRIILGIIGQWKYTNNILLFSSCYMIASIAISLMGYWNQILVLFTCSALTGFFFGAFGPILTEVTCKVFGASNFSTTYGFLMLFMALGFMSGAPVTGLVYDITHHYPASFYMCSASSFISSLSVLPLLLYQTKEDLQEDPLDVQMEKVSIHNTTMKHQHYVYANQV